MTNAHVVEGQTSVGFRSGTRHTRPEWSPSRPAATLPYCRSTTPTAAQPTLRLGSGGSARVGQDVIAVGSALGVLSNTVTRGIVSAVRQVGPVTLLQTDAAINPGNSGGPLIDRSGLVIGVNSMAVARHAGEGVAFAVAIDHVIDLMTNGTRRPTVRRRR